MVFISNEKVMNSQKYEWKNWSDIDWKVVERAIFKLQKRIFKASQRGDVSMVHRLQRLLTQSYYGRLWATRKVTQDNQGRKTAGVDGKKSLKPKERLELVSTLNMDKKAQPLRRVWIPKPNGEKRGLGIPTIYDRAKQCLFKLALEPQWEALFEENSYGFRPGRSCHDAIEAIFNAIRYKPKFVLDADIAKCFDKINHNKLLAKLETYPKLRRQIKNWMKSGVSENKITFPTEEGTPQGGVISPLLANIALHGMETEIKKFARTLKGRQKTNEQALNLIRYADDFVILHEKLEVVLECKKIIETWLKELGLELKPSKTLISHTLNEVEGNTGFDFLGFTIRQFPVGKNHTGKATNGKSLGFKTIIKPSKDQVKSHSQKLGKTIVKHKSSPQIALIKELNPIIRGWSNYYATVCSKETYSNCDSIMYQQLKRWGERRHPNKSKTWVAKKYWHTIGDRHWAFATKVDKGAFELFEHQKTPIVRHIKIKGNKSPYDGDMIYWSTRMGRHPEMDKRKSLLLKKQKGKCNHCGLYFKEGDLLETDHIVPTSLGGKDRADNLQLLHRHCHDKKTTTDGSLKNKDIDKLSESQLQALAEKLYEEKVIGKKSMTPREFNILKKTGKIKRL